MFYHNNKKNNSACPECRVTSDFVCPSAYWVDTKEEKAKLLGDYRKALNSKDCKYFKLGQGKCPFGNKCFYKHALKNGMLVDVGVPPRPVRRQNHLGDVDVLQVGGSFYLLYNMNAGFIQSEYFVFIY